MNEMFIMYAHIKKKSSHESDVPNNLEKDACVYFKVKNKLDMCDRLVWFG